MLKLNYFHYALIATVIFYTISVIFAKPSFSILTKRIGSEHSGYPGHKAVNRSLINGLQLTNAYWNLDPTMDQLGQVVMIPGNLNAVYQAIELKQQGKIKKLIIGPNIMENAYDFNRLATHRAIDICLVPSDWVKTCFETDEPSLRGRVKTWFAGVDTDFWQSTPHKKNSKNVLIYFKTGPEEFCHTVEEILAQHGWQTTRLTYQSHTQEQYKNLLSSVQFAVFISKSETQGIALAEAWSMDVPTLVWDPGENYNHGRFYKNISACPYLTPFTGTRWETFEQLRSILSTIETMLTSYAPRMWVLNNMTDALSAKQLLEIVQ